MVRCGGFEPPMAPLYYSFNKITSKTLYRITSRVPINLTLLNALELIFIPPLNILLISNKPATPIIKDMISIGIPMTAIKNSDIKTVNTVFTINIISYPIANCNR